MRLFLAVGCIVIPALAWAAPAGVTINELVSTTTTVTGERITLPPNPLLNVSRYTIAPGARLPVHKHPAQRYAYILAGEIDVTFPDLGRTMHSKAGDFIAEGADQWHFGTNNGKKPVELLVIDQLPENATTNTIMKETNPDE